MFERLGTENGLYYSFPFAAPEQRTLRVLYASPVVAFSPSSGPLKQEQLLLDMACTPSLWASADRRPFLKHDPRSTVVSWPNQSLS